LTLDEVVRAHARRIELYGGEPGVRDSAALEAAIGMPRAGFGDQYFHVDVWEMAAAYLFHIVQGHPFVDGNKRTGAAAADIFLTLNGFDLAPTEEDFEALVLRTARGECAKAEIAEFFRTHSRSIDSSP